MTAWRPFIALLSLQFRMLTRNRGACVVLLMLWVAGLLLSRQPVTEVDDTCYVLYWKNDAWIQYLRSTLPDDGQLKIELAPVEQFTTNSGLIAYPMGAHSIQIRPPETPTAPWRIWYWYSGNQPDVLQPAIRWFWQSSREFFGQRLPLEVRVSPLEPINPLVESTRIATREIFHRRHAKPLILLASLFFCGAYLPVLYIAEQTTTPVLDTVITKPIGIQGWGRATVLFHACLTITMTLPMLLVCGWLGEPRVWMALALAFSCYTALAFVIGCSCQSVATASSSVLMYGLVSGAIIAVAFLAPGIRPERISLEWSLIDLLRRPTATIATWSLLTSSCWAVIWCVLGSITFRRFARA